MSKSHVRINLILRGDVAQAFNDEYWKAVQRSQEEGASRPPSMAEIARTMVVENLRSRGYEVEDEIEWGGYRERGEEAESPDQVAVSAASAS